MSLGTDLGPELGKSGTFQAGERVRLIRTIDALVMFALFGLAVGLAWPVYHSNAYLLCAGSAILLMASLAYVFTLVRTLKARYVWLLALPVYFLAVIPVAVPSALWDFPSNVPYGLRQAVVAPATAWKELVSLDPPVGSFGAVLVPTFLVFGLSALLAAMIQVRRPAWVGWQVVAAAIPLVFAIITGPAMTRDVAGPWGIELISAREAMIGAAWVVVVILWLTGRFSARRRRIRTLDAQGQQRSAFTLGIAIRYAAGALTLILGIVVSVAFVPGILPERVVARTVVEPRIVQPPADSPLSTFRANFAPANLNRTLFSVSGSDVPDRVRIATLASYRGDTYTAIDETSAASSSESFRILAHRIEGVPGEVKTANFVIDGYNGVWLPTAGHTIAVDFDGEPALNLRTHTYVSPATSGLIVMAPRADGQIGLLAGDTYRVDYVEPQWASAGGRSPGHSVRWKDDSLPELYSWLEREQLSLATVADVQAAVDKMMWASYLGHSLDDPTEVTGGREGTWLEDLPATYDLRKSYGGHNLRAIDANVFAKLSDPSVPDCSGPQDNSCAAIVGDDEQFAVAAALIAQAGGFPARIVVGAEPDSDGVVRGKNMRAWAEIQAADGRWAPLEATARTDNTFRKEDSQPDTNQYRNPVDRTTTNQTTPPDVRDQAGAERADGPTARESEGSSAIEVIRTALYVVGGLLALLLLTAPLWLALVWKALRRRRRRSGGDAEDQIASGWDEFVDRCVDRGFVRPATDTRSEFAASTGSDQAVVLARLADQAVFGDADPQPAHSTQFWELLDTEVSNQTKRLSRWQRVKARFTWRSIVRRRRRGASSTAGRNPR